MFTDTQMKIEKQNGFWVAIYNGKPIVARSTFRDAIKSAQFVLDRPAMLKELTN